MSTAPVWQSMAQAAGVLLPDGRPGNTIFADMSALAARSGSINLGQGAPGTPADPGVAAAAAEAIAAGHNQYSPSQGVPALLEAVAAHQRHWYDLEVSSDQVLTTTGATEGLYATILALVPAGGEIVVFEPYYDSYAAAAAAAGATLRTVPLDPLDLSFDAEALRAAFGPQTAAVLLNTPHNPTGKVFVEDELRLIAELASTHDALIITDEVYEHLVFDGIRHVPIATLPEAAERTVTVSSAGKSFNVTGWKVGWVVAPTAELREEIQAVKQYTTFISGSPFQHAIAAGLAQPDEQYAARARSLQDRRDVLLAGLEQVPGLRFSLPPGGYFTVADVSALTDADATTVVRRMSETIGIVGIPLPAFYAPGSAAQQAARSLIRLSFCQTPEAMEEAARRFAAVDPGVLG